LSSPWDTSKSIDPHAVGKKHPDQLMHVARKNAALATFGLSVQLFTDILYLLLDMYFSVDIFWVSILAEIVGQLDLMISTLCCLGMTNIWMPRSILNFLKALNVSDRSAQESKQLSGQVSSNPMLEVRSGTKLSSQVAHGADMD